MNLSTKEFCDFIKERFGVTPQPWYPGADVKVAWVKDIDELRKMGLNWSVRGFAYEEQTARLVSVSNNLGIRMDCFSDLQYLATHRHISVVVNDIVVNKQIFFIGDFENKIINIEELI